MDDLLEHLIRTGERYVSDLTYDMRRQSLPFSERDKIDLSIATEETITLLRDEPRKVENAYFFEHALTINNLMFNAYKNPSSPKKFLDCFRENYIEMIHTALFHDAVEKKVMSLEEIENFYNRIGMQGSVIASNVDKLTFPKRANSKEINQKLAELQKHPVPLYIKIFDIMHNSSSEGTEREFMKMRYHYKKLIEYNFNPMYRDFLKNLAKHNLKKIAKLVETEDLPDSSVRGIAGPIMEY